MDFKSPKTTGKGVCEVYSIASKLKILQMGRPLIIGYSIERSQRGGYHNIISSRKQAYS